MIKRTISTLALWAILILAVYYGKALGFTALLLLLSLAAGFEACELVRKCGNHPSFSAFGVSTAFLFLAIILNETLGFTPTEAFGAAVSLLLVMFALWVLKSPYSGLVRHTIAPTLLIVLFVPVMLASLSLCAFKGDGYTGIILAIWIIAAAKFSDIGGYLFGVTLGKHKLAPTISPKKSWEGAIGGIALSVGISALIAWGFKDKLPENFTPLAAAIIAFPIAIVAIISDLLESVLKRRAGIKDSGNTIPGIGGALDLADSMLLAAPIASFIVLSLYF